ncbi:MAG: hypothetical protein A6F71_01770 [Cycloclasticus sp. symbiont of Poecilosclerida sp. M]|nr:MAG: hypothetical protein A6F71_01770 [Cycloclasticus sp. symbiont of Poecilosclerida sp. M]
MNKEKKIILASASPRRQKLLMQIGVDCDVCPADIDESVLANEKVKNYVIRLAKSKALYVKKKQRGKKIYLGADTIVVIGKEILGKPVDKNDAVRMLTQLSGSTHRVLTAVAVIGKTLNCRMSESRVTFKALSETEIEGYWSTDEPNDKAGAYAIQGKAATFITHLEGSFSGVMGLPLYETAQMLLKENVELS